ncbi:F0F1 ATP synthase subunit, putative ATPase gene1 family [Pseudogulbenkiania sp. NH8B]|uniref:AtpZ/AtpI family protein n=1 Tax=Pseudogulbenkiania sp. (strain NH8B) TaxID=748280 RepID=UPI00022798EE|nr:AtpZ/AtpI family protein [Pseudogulbenkiania sp. NH8B]BAK77280.1 F0F1 ATP synthase subunit, putative ATPase gene1 family [Pseudogulbenkiania sp. NH8B]
MSQRDDKLRDSLQTQLQRRRRFRPGGPIGLILIGGTVGLLFVVPLLLGAYLGRWLDTHLAGYSVRWTISLIVLGIVVGAYNVYRFLKGLDQ